MMNIKDWLFEAKPSETIKISKKDLNVKRFYTDPQYRADMAATLLRRFGGYETLSEDQIWEALEKQRLLHRLTCFKPGSDKKSKNIENRIFTTCETIYTASSIVRVRATTSYLLPTVEAIVDDSVLLPKYYMIFTFTPLLALEFEERLQKAQPLPPNIFPMNYRSGISKILNLQLFNINDLLREVWSEALLLVGAI